MYVSSHAPNIKCQMSQVHRSLKKCGYSVWNLLRVTLLESRILRWPLHFWETSKLMFLRTVLYWYEQGRVISKQLWNHQSSLQAIYRTSLVHAASHTIRSRPKILWQMCEYARLIHFICIWLRNQNKIYPLPGNLGTGVIWLKTLGGGGISTMRIYAVRLARWITLV